MICVECNKDKFDVEMYKEEDITYHHIIGIAYVCTECKKKYEEDNNVILRK